MSSHDVDPFARTPEPPYYAVIFTSTRQLPAAGEDDGYGDMADRMVELAKTMPGFLGVESVREATAPGAPGITVSYWQSLEHIAAWKAQAEHQQARRLGREQWYEGFQVRVCKVERAYSFMRQP